ncbi:MAG: hypothetical protein IKR59_08040, partial [Lachnospiraceae bacterium]|nr:hypothetical protein [Lachnospiraceae bacterium]
MEYIFTERAHLMCPHMHFGIALAVNQPYDEAKIRKAAEDLSAAHPFLSAFLGFEPGTNAYYYDVTDGSKTEILFMQQEISGIGAPEVMEEYQKLTCRDWNLFEEGMLKIAAWKAAEKTCFLMVFHHLLADGRGALRLSEELADDYAFGIVPKAVPEKLISSADDFPKDSRLPFISRLLVKKANKDWKKENRTLSYGEYHAFADDFLRKDPVKYSLDTLSSDELEGVR